tara:strand:+ start:846 stop:1193 length:348 start_codon:yes stop_codon:yes gene_type:complete
MAKKKEGIMDFDSLLNSQLGQMVGLTEKDRSKFEKRKKSKIKVKKIKPKKMSNGGSNKMINEPEFKDLRKALRKIEIGLTNIPKSQRGKGMGKKIRNMKKNPIMKNRGGTFKGVY